MKQGELDVPDVERLRLEIMKDLQLYVEIPRLSFGPAERQEIRMQK